MSISQWLYSVVMRLHIIAVSSNDKVQERMKIEVP